MGEDGRDGQDGQDGQDGADGQLRIYGNGSAGDKLVDANASLTDVNLQYGTFIVESGVTLTVPSGAVIRCQGDFVNMGTIRVSTAAAGGFRSPEAPADVASPPHPGVARRAATHGQLGGIGATLLGGLGGSGVSAFEARQLFMPGIYGGGGGGAAGSDTFTIPPLPVNVGMAGGGSFVIIAGGGILNDGVIEANGASGNGLLGAGGGGGGGGIVVLASAVGVTNAGEVHADGGEGEDSDADEGASGGGGGGIIHLVAPLIDNAGMLTADGGAAGEATGGITETARSAGGGGGACGGAGGAGGDVTRQPLMPTRGLPLPAEDGRTGYILQTAVDPTSLF